MTYVSLIQPRHQPPLCHPLLLTLVSLNIASEGVPGTAWMVAFVLTYKLCERGEATLPVASLTFWKGVVRSVNNTMDKYINN